MTSNDRIAKIREAEHYSHTVAYTNYTLFSPGSWLAKPIKAVTDLLPRFADTPDFCALDLGCGVGRNSIPIAQAIAPRACRIDCVDIMELAIQKLQENSRAYGVSESIQGIVSSIEDFVILPDHYDLILAISSLEHMESEAAFSRKLAEMRDGLRAGGILCLVINSEVSEFDPKTEAFVDPQFELNLLTASMEQHLQDTFAGFEVLKQTVTHQQYDIPRAQTTVHLSSNVVSLTARKPAETSQINP